MRPKVIINKLHAPKKVVVDPEPLAAHPAPPLTEASAAKQLKQKKLLKAKLKRAVPKMMVAAPANSAAPDAPNQLLRQGKPKKKAAKRPPPQQQQQESQAPKLEAMAEEPPTQPKKRKQLLLASKAAEDKRPRIDANGAAPAPDGSHLERTPAGMPGYLADTGPVRDPVLRAEISDWLRLRAGSTVRVGQLPNRLRPTQISQLCQGIQAARVPWNYATGRNKGVAFLEFATPDTARRALTELATSKHLGGRVAPTIRDDPDQELNIDAYNCRRVVVSSLHPLTTGQELKDLVGGGGVQRVDFAHGSKALRKHAPAVAFLTFADERRALDAVKKFQGHVIRSRGTSWLLQRRSERPEHSRHRTELVAFGVSKRVSDDDILKAFPKSQSIDVRHAHGMAIVTYASEEECRADYGACKGGLARIGKAKLRVQFGHAQHRPREQRQAEARLAQQQELQEQLQHQPQHQRPPRPAPSKIDPSLFNKCQLIVKNFKPATQEADLTGFLPGARRVFFTGNHRLAFVHFAEESAASAALEKLSAETLNGAKLKAMYAMDKPDKKKAAPESGGDRRDRMPRQQQHDEAQQDVAMDDEQKQQRPVKKFQQRSQLPFSAAGADGDKWGARKPKLELEASTAATRPQKFGGGGGGGSTKHHLATGRPPGKPGARQSRVNPA